MTKKHFRAIAEIIKQEIDDSPECQDDFNNGCRYTAKQIGKKLASFCATMNPRFDRTKFLTACGIE